MRVALIKDGVVDNIIVSIDVMSGAVDVSNLNIAIGDLYDGITFTKPVVEEPVDLNSYMFVTADAERIAPNGTVTLTIQIKDHVDELLPVNSEYLVPLIRHSDNHQTDLLLFQFVNGECSKTINIAEKGIYSVKMEKIKPLPTSILQSNIEIIVI